MQKYYYNCSSMLKTDGHNFGSDFENLYALSPFLKKTKLKLTPKIKHAYNTCKLHYF